MVCARSARNSGATRIEQQVGGLFYRLEVEEPDFAASGEFFAGRRGKLEAGKTMLRRTFPANAKLVDHARSLAETAGLPHDENVPVLDQQLPARNDAFHGFRWICQRRRSPRRLAAVIFCHE